MDSVGGLLVLLHENDQELRGDALGKLHSVVDSHWSEILEQIDNIENLATEDEFQFQQLAAAVASKCFYHLEEYNYSLQYALKAGQYFDAEKNEEYEMTIVGKCIEAYIELNRRERELEQLGEEGEGGGEGEGEEDDLGVDDELRQLLEMKDDLERIVSELLNKCYNSGNFHEALGIALEAHQIEKVRTTIQKSGSMMREILTDCLNYCQKLLKSRDFRRRVMEVLAEMYYEQTSPNFLELSVVLHSLGKVKEFAKLLLELLKDEEQYLVAFQIGFDLMELQDQKFVSQLLKNLPEYKGDDGKGGEGQGQGEGEEKEGEQQEKAPMTAVDERVQNLLSIIGQGKTTSIYLDFLYHHNKTDLLIMKNVKNAVEAGRKNSVLHNATIMMHAFAQAGTTVDNFFRTHSKFVEQASNWAKFSASATIGVIHKGNVTSAFNILEAFLPKDNTSTDAYTEGGAMYSIGLIHALEGSSKVGEKALDYLLTKLRAAGTQAEERTRDAHQHGCCLAIGLLAMSSGDGELAELLFQDIVNQDRAVPGEAAALAVGMVLLGGGSEQHKKLVTDMLAYAVNTKHEKIIRALGMSIAMIMYGLEEEADMLIEQLCGEKDSLLRYGGMYVVGFAYAGTANNSAIRRLLRVAVSDVNNDVRRAAVTSLGFVLLNSPERLPSLIELLSESYNPHVRYGAAMALGIACSGMSDAAEALTLLDALREDKVDFVRQGAMIATAMLLMQHTPEKDKRAKEFREKLMTTVEDAKHSSTMTRMGAIIASGIIDAGGRNVNIELMSRTGVTRPPAVIGMALFAQYWYWYPLMHMLTLSFSPTALIGLNSNLDMPNSFRVECDADLAQFDYPKPVTAKKVEKQERVETAVLSMTAKARAAEAAKAKDKGKEEKPEVKEKEDPMEEEKQTDEELEKLREDALKNPLRVTRKQQGKIRFLDNLRYRPVANDGHHKSGIVLLRDTKGGEDTDVKKISVPPLTTITPAAEGGANLGPGATGGTVPTPQSFVFQPQQN